MNQPNGSTTTRFPDGCVNPIRLRGFYQRISATTGEVLLTIGSGEPGGSVVLVACKDRRVCRCPSCARLYERDAYQLIAAGLRGGKSIPATVGAHPAVMLTLTAPSFGAVHNNPEGGRPCSCGARHRADDPQLGAPLDPDRYRYQEQVIWNHYAPQLWKRTVQAVRRGLANALRVPRSQLRHIASVRFAKVAEFQRRGVVHYHAIIRIDGPDGPAQAPPTKCTTELLASIVDAARRTARSDLAPILGAPSSMLRTVRWGSQHEIRSLDAIRALRLPATSPSTPPKPPRPRPAVTTSRPSSPERTSGSSSYRARSPTRPYRLDDRRDA